MPDGGKLIISMHNQALGKHEFDKQKIQSGDYVMISISDSGCGISNEIQEHIFNPFFSTKDVGKGTGLGLSMEFSFINRNRGHINLYSEPDEGTRIHLYFPRATNKTKQHKESQASEVITVKGENEIILIVDDEEQLRELTIEILNAQGYQTLSAKDGAEAIDILRSQQTVDLLFSDIVMPGDLNGYQLAEKARELRPHIKIQLTTGLANISPVNSQQAAASMNVLQKPYSRVNLITCINKIFGR